MTLNRDVFLDTNIFLGFATDFEEDHERCKEVFFRNYTRRTGSRVNSELNRVKSRRYRVIYNDLLDFLKRQMPINRFTPSVTLNENDGRHLKQLLKQLRKLSATKTLNYLRHKIREIWDGVKYALTLVCRPFITLYNYVICEVAINRCINNLNDARILSDALCWAENNQPLIFCTSDNKDFVSNRTMIYQRIAHIRSYGLDDVPIEIRGIKEIIP